MSFKDLPDKEKMEYFENKLKQVTIDLFLKKINNDEFSPKFDKYCAYVNHYRRKLNMPLMFQENKNDNNEDDDDELLVMCKPEPLVLEKEYDESEVIEKI